MLCIGHRGAMGYAPENTLKSLEKAIELGATWVEVDVHYVDKHLIVMHDDRLERTTNGEGFLADKTFSYLRSLDAGDGEKIPTLDEVLDLVWDKTSINIELKGPGTARPVMDLLQKRISPEWGKENFLISSLNHQSLYEVRKLDNSIRLGVLLEEITYNCPAVAEDLNAYSVNQDICFVNDDFVLDTHNRGFKIFVYTVNEPDDIESMISMGVDGVFTDYPDRVLTLVQDGNKKCPR